MIPAMTEPAGTATPPRQAVELWKNRPRGNGKDCCSAETGFPQSHSLDDDDEFFNNYSKTGLDFL